MDGRKTREQERGRNSLSQKQIEAIQYSLTGLTQGQIADAVGVSRATVNKWFKNPLFKTYREELQAALEKKSTDYVIKIYDDIRDELYRIVMQGNSEAARVKAAQVLLQLAGLTKTKTELTVTDGTKELATWLTSDSEVVEDFLGSISTDGEV